MLFLNSVAIPMTFTSHPVFMTWMSRPEMATLVLVKSPSPTSKSAPAITTPASLKLRQQSQTDCDGVGTFTCPTGTCYTGLDGFIGCCSVSSCAARTTCLPYHGSTDSSYDPNTDGYISCSPPNSACVTISNALEDQYIFYCSNVATVVTLSYRNLVTTGSTASSPSKSGDSTPSTQIPTNVSTQSSPAASKTTSSSSPTASVVTADEQASLPRHTLAAIIAPIICVALLLVFCLYMFCVRPRLARKHDASPSAGTLGGASLPGPIQETSSQMRDPRKTLPIWSRARAKESPISSAPDTRISSPQTLVSTTPLPNCTQQSPKLELDSKPVSPHTPHTPGASTIRPVELSPTSSTFPSTPNPPTPPSTHKPPLQNSPTVSSENHHVSLALSSLSPEERDSRYLSLPTTVNSHTNRLSATGSWKGYLTPEEAMNGGWRAEEQENGD